MSAIAATQISNQPEAFIHAVQGALKTTSLKVAEAFGKRHSDVLRKIDTLDCPQEFTCAHFCADVQTVNLGQGAKRESRVVEMDKDGFMFLVMGFTGHKAAQIKVAYINAFNWMADQLQPTHFTDQGIYLSHDQAQTLYLLLHEVDWVNYRWHQGIGRGVAAINRPLYGSTCEHVDNMARTGRLLDKQLPCIKRKFSHLGGRRPRY